MKKLCLSLLFLFISFQFFSQEKDKLPKIPWEEIVEINNGGNTKIHKWNKDIFVSLEGNYTQQDSLEVDRIIKKFDAITETISIRFAINERANFRIKYLNDYKYHTYNSNVVKEQRTYTDKNKITAVDVFLYTVNKTNKELRSSLETKIAKRLVMGLFHYKLYRTKRKSIFNGYPYRTYENSNLNKQDLKIITEIYKKGFYKRLNIAEKQFKESVIDEIDNAKISDRDRSLWWVRNPIAIIILPALLLLLLSFHILGKVRKFLSAKVKKDWLQFGISGITLLFFADIIIILAVSTFDFLTIPDDYRKVPFVRYDSILTTITLSLISIPILFLFRFIELKIQQKANSILVKTFLIFISTGFLPFIFLFLFIFLANNKTGNYNGSYALLANAFLILIIIATLRTLISYFIFKEKKLILDNELKLSNLRELKTKAELKSLQAQINPHFLYNSLNSIASLAPIDAVKTQKMAHSLSDLFKYSINRKNENVGFIKDEIKMVKTYLEIEKIRFGDHLQFTINVDTSLENHKIPLFLIQPLVENAVKHGISKNVEEGQIDINIKKKNNEICISVSDNGPNFPEGLLSGHGLQTVYDLLRLNYKGKASLNWTNTPEKMIRITILEIV